MKHFHRDAHLLVLRSRFSCPFFSSRIIVWFMRYFRNQFCSTRSWARGKGVGGILLGYHVVFSVYLFVVSPLRTSLAFPLWEAGSRNTQYFRGCLRMVKDFRAGISPIYGAAFRNAMWWKALWLYRLYICQVDRLSLSVLDSVWVGVLAGEKSLSVLYHA